MGFAFRNEAQEKFMKIGNKVSDKFEDEVRADFVIGMMRFDDFVTFDFTKDEKEKNETKETIKFIVSKFVSDMPRATMETFAKEVGDKVAKNGIKVTFNMNKKSEKVIARNNRFF